jgi:PEP-CTERM motif
MRLTSWLSRFGGSASALALVALFTMQAAQASPIDVSGSLADPSNPNLVGSAPGSSPDFTDASTIAQNVNLTTFIVPFGGFADFIVPFGGFADSLTDSETTGLFSFGPTSSVIISSGLINPYFSLFAGSGGSATFVTAMSMGPSTTPGTFTVHVFLEAGTYTMALGVAGNESVAESSEGGGTLGDGFIGEGDPSQLGSGRFAATILIPEPETLLLLAIGIAAAGLGRRRTRR